MNVQFLSNEKGEKTAAVIPIEYWNKIKKQLKIEEPDFWNGLPDHVKDGIEKAQKQFFAGETKTDDEVMDSFKKYL
ncbi:hypothetical protein [Dyadobacter sp. 3J3]|uniref:hypothetical protein n=1 Tax=Dyadobacter sp. 3J3 TaxID=2606600 RepID=UPI00135727D9|nr:hypothetical protein [Dyadobacter sp. 3J3]